MMDSSSFEDHLDRYGGDLALWPKPARDEGIVLLAQSEGARRARQAMSEVETLLRATRPPSNTTDITAAVAMRHGQAARSRRYAMRTGWGIAAAVALFLGYAVGDVAHDRDESAKQLMAYSLDASGVGDVD